MNGSENNESNLASAAFAASCASTTFARADAGLLVITDGDGASPPGNLPVCFVPAASFLLRWSARLAASVSRLASSPLNFLNVLFTSPITGALGSLPEGTARG